MSRRRSNKSRSEEPSLVPLADMLTNTVGIMLFILAFAVLVTGGAVVARRLPMESSGNAKAIYFLCVSNAVVPVNPNLVERKYGFSTYIFNDRFEANECARRLNGARAEDEYFVCTAETDGIFSGRMRDDNRTVYVPDLTTRYTYKAGTGYPRSQLNNPAGPFLKTLATNHAKKTFAYFYVRPEALGTFWEARELANQRGLGSGWFPLNNSNIVTGTRGGLAAKEQ